MADLTDIQAAQAVKLVGSSSAGVETTPAQTTTDGELYGKVSPEPLFDILPQHEHVMNAGSSALNVNGSVTPVLFTLAPTGSEVWFITKLILVIADAGATNLSAFGTIAGGLANGLHIEIKSKGVLRTLSNLKTNGDIACAFSQGLIGTGTFFNESDFFSGQLDMPFPVKLRASDGDFLRVTIRDNATAVDYLKLAATTFMRN